MTVSRGIAIVAIAAVAIVAWLLLAGGNTHHYTLVFQNAGQLVKGNDVQIGGRRVGNVDDIKLGKNNLAEVKVSIQEPYAPLHAGSTAQIRSGSLSGVANRFVSINPGPNSSQKIDDDQTLGLDTTTSAVDLDQLFNTLDPKARKSLQQVIDGSATQYK